MSSYLIVESREPFESRDCAYGIARDLVRAGHVVTLFLVQNGVLPARRGASADGLAEAVQAGVQVLADEFSLRERGISGDRLAAGVRRAPLDAVIDQLVEGRKAFWH